MLRFSFSLLTLSFLIYRIEIFTVPFFQAALVKAPFRNIFCGLFSDLSVLSALALFWLCLGSATSRWPRTKKVIGIASIAVSIFLTFWLASAIHYVEYFGMNTRYYHLNALSTFDMWLTGFMMVTGSVRALVLLSATAGLSFALGKQAQTVSIWATDKFSSSPKIVMTFLVVSAAAFNSGMIKMRKLPDMHHELRANPLVSLYNDYKKNHDTSYLASPNKQERLLLRKMVQTQRNYSTDPQLTDFPLWQNSLPQRDASTPSAKIGAKFEEFLSKEAKEKGPWNVLLLTSESLRAYEIDVLNGGKSQDKNFQGTTPFITELASRSISFSETHATGATTAVGQVASQCSAYGTDSTTFMVLAPLTNAVCLGDVFGSRGYQNHFFYPSDNHFDNQGIFYERHAYQNIHGEHLMSKDGAKGGWGYGDKALYDYTLSTLSKSKKPFFATVLNLTNHQPYVIPSDAPESIKRSKRPLSAKMYEYVDWAMGDFYGKLSQKFPHTVFIMIADHGTYRYVKSGIGLQPYKQVRKATRIPWMITVPNMPEEFAGQKIDNLVVNSDLPPTLLSILGWSQTKQSFMGENAFTRTGPIYLDWQRKLIRISRSKKSGISVEETSSSFDEIIAKIPRYNLLAPPAEMR